MSGNVEPGIALELAREVIARGELLTVRARGWSMGDTIPPGARVHLRKPQKDSIAPGDIVVYEVGGRLAGHRVLNRWRDGRTTWFLTGGDARRMPDQPVREERILAMVTAIETEEGRCLPVVRRLRRPMLAGAFALAWRLRRRLIPSRRS